MCLTIKPVKQVYKVYYDRGNDKYSPIYRGGELTLPRNRTIRSNRRSTTLTAEEICSSSVHRGFHCFARLKDAVVFSRYRGNVAIVEFNAKIENLVAAGTWGSNAVVNEVYTQLTVNGVVAVRKYTKDQHPKLRWVCPTAKLQYYNDLKK